MNEYQALNLLDLLSRNTQFDNGDWFAELMHEATETVRKAGDTGLHNNFGDEIKVLESVVEVNGHRWFA